MIKDFDSSIRFFVEKSNSEIRILKSEIEMRSVSWLRASNLLATPSHPVGGQWLFLGVQSLYGLHIVAFVAHYSSGAATDFHRFPFTVLNNMQRTQFLLMKIVKQILKSKDFLLEYF